MRPKPTPAKRVIQFIVFAIFGGFGVVMLYVGVTQFFLQRALTSAPRRVTATVVSSEVKVLTSSDTDHRPLRDNSTTSYRPEVTFAYEIDGRRYESDLLRPTIIVQDRGSRSTAEQEIAAFPTGAIVEAYYTPKYPAQAYLLLETSPGPVVFIFVGLIVPVVTWFAVKLI